MTDLATTNAEPLLATEEKPELQPSVISHTIRPVKPVELAFEHLDVSLYQLRGEKKTILHGAFIYCFSCGDRGKILFLLLTIMIFRFICGLQTRYFNCHFGRKWFW